MKSSIIKLSFFITVITLYSCNIAKNSNTSALVLSLNNTRTITPEISMEVDNYEITGQGPSGANFHLSNITTNTKTIGNLLTGDWIITVNGKNTASEVIATGTTEITLTEYSNSCSVDLTPLTGSGHIELNFDWSDLEIANPSITATVSPVEEGTPVEVIFNISESTATALTPLNSGYYILNAELYENAVPTGKGVTNAIRVITDNTTNYAYSFQ